MAKQLASVPEDSPNGFTVPYLPWNPYRLGESIRSVAGPVWRIRSALSSQFGPSGSNSSSISAAASSSYPSNTSGWSSGSLSAGAADLEAQELYRGCPSIHKLSSSLAKYPASMPEESTTTNSTAPCHSYRESIRSVGIVWPKWHIGSTLSSQSGQSGSNYSSNSGTSSSYLSNISGYSIGSSASAAPAECTDELTMIAHRMISDDYTQRVVQAFKNGGEQAHALETWFIQLDISWVFQMHVNYGYAWRFHLLDNSASCLQDLAQRWIRALTISVVSIKMLVAAVDDTLAVGWFGKATISAMLVFVNAIVDVRNVEKIQAMLYMYICVSNASHDMLRMQHVVPSEAKSIFAEICASLEREENRLVQTISSTMSNMRMTLTNDDSWAIEIPRGGGEVHGNIRFLVDCIVSMRKTWASTHKSAQSQHTEELHDVIDDTIDYLNDLIMMKSKLCSDPSLRYLFLLNNSYFVAQVVPGPWGLFNHQGVNLTPECQNYMDSYIDVSWGHVLSCIPKSNFPGGLLHRMINASPLAKFESAFHQTYQNQKLWKVPDPQLRNLLREDIIKRVISGYQDYLKDHQELEKQVCGGSNSPEVLEEMLGELFEG